MQQLKKNKIWKAISKRLFIRSKKIESYPRR